MKLTVISIPNVLPISCPTVSHAHTPDQTEENTLDHILFLLLFAGTFDDMRQISDRDAEWEVERGKHNGEEDPPACQGGDKGECATRLSKNC